MKKRSMSSNGALQPEIEILAEVHTPYFRIAAQRIRPARAENLPVIDNVRAVGHHQSFADVVIGHQYPDSRALQLKNDALQLQDLNRINAGKRLVQQEKFRIDRQ